MVRHVQTYKKNSAVVKLPKPQKHNKDLSARHQLVKEVIHECMGFAPYERHIVELLRLNKDRAAVRFANDRIGKFTLAKKKVSELSNFK